MNITATLDGEVVTIVGINGNGRDVYISYVTTSSNLEYKTKMFLEDFLIIATNATIN